MSFTDPDDVYATCTAAADLIERDGLFRRSFWGEPQGRSRTRYEPGMPLCTIGAIRVAIGHYNDLDYDFDAWPACRTVDAVREELRGRRGGHDVGIGVWNDTEAADAAEVVELLRHVATKNMPDEYHSGSPE